jgi:succinoglycan biosynthesis transport protein ExoP
MNSISRLEDIGTPAAFAQDVDLGRLLRTLWRRRWVIAAVTGLALAAAIFSLSQITPIYTSTAEVMIDSRQGRFLDGGGPADAIVTDTAVMSEVEVMSSRNVAKRVADNLNLYADKRFNPQLDQATGNRFLKTVALLFDEIKQIILGKPKTAAITAAEQERLRNDDVVDGVLGGLVIEPVPQSLVIRIQMQSPDPALAAKLADAYAQAYIEEQLESKFQAVRYISTWLNGRLESLRSAVVDSEHAVAAYRSANGLVDAPGPSTNQQQLSELNSQLVTAQAKRAETEARLSRVESAMQSGHGADVADDLIDSPLVQRLKEQEATLARTVTEMKSRYGERHPEMVKAQSDLDQVHRQLDAEMQSQVKTLRADFAVQRQRETAILNQIHTVESSVLGQSEAQIKLRELEREAQANRVLYETFLSKFKESGEQQLIKQADARIISPADIPRSPSYPKRRVILMASGVLGFLGGIALVLVLEQLDRTIRTRDQLEDLLGLPAFALIPQLKTGIGEDSVNRYVVDNPNSSYAEALRMVWVGIQHNGGPGRIVVVTSSVPEEGKSLTSISLARVVSAAGLRVAVIDADLRRATLAAKAGIAPVHTIADVIAGRSTIDDAIMRDPLSSVDFLLGRSPNHKDINLLAASDRMAEIFATLRERYDLVIADSPPALAIADVQVLAKLADLTLFCVRWDKTPRDTVLSAIRSLRDARAKVAGTLMTRVNIRKHSQYGYHDIGYYYARYRSYYSE